MESGTGANAVVPFFAHLTLYHFKFLYVGGRTRGTRGPCLPPRFFTLMVLAPQIRSTSCHGMVMMGCHAPCT